MGNKSTVDVDQESHKKANEIKTRMKRKYRLNLRLYEIYVVAIQKGIDNITEKELIDLYRIY